MSNSFLDNIAPIDSTITLPRRIFDELLRLVRSGNLQPGDKLPSESQLMEAFNVGRSSVREAIQGLQLLGVLETIPGKGTFLKDPGLAGVSLAIEEIEEVPMTKIQELLEVREILELGVATLVVERATDKDIRDLEAILRYQNENIDDFFKISTLSGSFHIRLTDATRNRHLSLLHREIHEVYIRTAKLLAHSPSNFPQWYNSHKTIMGALKERNASSMIDAIRSHLADLKQQLRHPSGIQDKAVSDLK